MESEFSKLKFYDENTSNSNTQTALADYWIAFGTRYGLKHTRII